MIDHAENFHRLLIAESNAATNVEHYASMARLKTAWELWQQVATQPATPTIFDVRSYDAGQTGDWNADVPREVQAELMQVAQAKAMSLDYLCAIYRKGRTDAPLPPDPRYRPRPRRKREAK